MNFNYEQRKNELARERVSQTAAEQLPHNAPLWQDVNDFFKEIFTEHPERDHVDYTPELLILDLCVRFHGKYREDEIYKMCRMGYDQVRKGLFRFRRTDFILTKEVSHA